MAGGAESVSRMKWSWWVYTGSGLIIIDLLLMVVRYLGVVFKTNAVAVLAVHHGVDIEAQNLLHFANILNMVRWKWIGEIFVLGAILLLIGLLRPFSRRD